MTKHRTKYYDDRTRPATVVVPKDFPIQRLKPGVARERPPRLGSALKITIRCENCDHETTVERNKGQLRHIRGNCQSCGRAFNVQWSGVRRG
jgi:hypothetical protein